MFKPSQHSRKSLQGWALASLLLAASLLVLARFHWAPGVEASQFTKLGLADDEASEAHALVEGVKLLSAAFIGILVTCVQRFTRRDQPLTRSMEQTNVLLCVSGALTMIIIGGSVARAFGIAGAATIIRFRTPVDDPRDITVLYLLMALGMAAGLGLESAAGIGTLFLCACLLTIGRSNRDMPRSMKVVLVADGQDFPAAHVSKVFAEHRVTVAPLEIFHGDHTTVRYRAVLEADSPLEKVSADLLNGGTVGLKSVSWEAPKKNV